VGVASLSNLSSASVRIAIVVNGIIAVLISMVTVLHVSSCSRAALSPVQSIDVLEGVRRDFLLAELS